jgi:hypothetical protein
MRIENKPEEIHLVLDCQIENMDQEIETLDFNSLDHEFTFWGEGESTSESDVNYILKSKHSELQAENEKLRQSNRPASIEWFTYDQADNWFKENFTPEELDGNDGIEKFFYANHIASMIIDFQQELRKRVNVVDPVELLNKITSELSERRLYTGYDNGECKEYNELDEHEISELAKDILNLYIETQNKKG